MEHDKVFKLTKVLLIDDAEVDRYIATRIISKSCYAKDVVAFDGGLEALCYLRPMTHAGELPAIIFLDISMPGMDGFEFLDLFEQLPEVIKKNCPVVILSSSHDVNDYQRASAYKSVLRFLNKPLTPEKLESLHMEPAVDS